MQNLKLKRLKTILKNLKSVVVAYSGGLDSTFLLKVAIDTLGRDNVIAVTARSETYPESEYRCALKMAGKMRSRRMTIETKELDIKNFRNNPINRCYYCKGELFRRLKDIAKENKMKYVVDGANYDDLNDIRHGMKAAQELGVRSPLLEAKIGKALIRRYSRRLRLETWSKPSFACLASRFPYRENIDEATLVKIDKAEGYLRKLGIRQVRVRVHKDVARIETYKDDIAKMLKNRERIVRFLKPLGFIYITLDLEGYRTGSMHAPFLGIHIDNGFTKV